MATKREYLIGLGLAKPGRGRFSKEANDALVAAAAAGVTFDEPVKVPAAKAVTTEGADAPSQSPRPTSESSEVRAWAAQNGVKVGERGRVPANVMAAFRNGDAKAVASGPAKVYSVAPQVRTRQVKTFYGATAEGATVGWSMCRRCAQHVSWCKCGTGPKPPSIVVKSLDRIDAL